MEILKIIALNGPNHLAKDRVLIVQVQCPATELVASGRRKLRSRSESWLIDLKKQMQQTSPLAGQISLAESAVISRFVQRLPEAIGPVEFVQYWAQILQLATGVNAEFGHTVSEHKANKFEIAFQFEEELLAHACLENAINLWKAATQGEDIDFAAVLRALINLADDVRLGPSTRAIVSAAGKRGIPFRRLTAGSLVQLGEGKLQRRIWTAETDATGAIAEDIAQNKSLTKKLLHSLGVPVPRGRLVTSADDAWLAACEIGTPVAVKPSQANHAQGVSLNLFTRAQITAAFSFAEQVCEGTENIIVEQFISGEAYRLLVVGGQMVAAAKSESEFLTGDGKRSIRELIDEANRDPRRGENYTDPLALLDLEVPTLLELEKQGLTPDSIPEANQRVLLQLVGDYTADCTKEVHPETAEHAALAARLIGLDVAGIDIVACDIGQPLIGQRGAILEVNAGPALAMHIAPLTGSPQPVGEAIVAQLFPSESNGRIPVFVVTGDGERSAVLKLMERLLRKTDKVIGRAEREGVFVGGRRIALAHPTDYENTEALLLHPDVEVAIIESRGEEAVARGLGCSRADVAVITEATQSESANAEFVGTKGLGGLGALAAVRAVPPEGTAVLPASEWSRRSLAPACRGKVIYCSTSEKFDIKDFNLKLGDGVCWRRDNGLVITKNDGEHAIELPADFLNAQIDPNLLLLGCCGVWVSGIGLKID